MLKPIAFGNAFGAGAVIFFVALYILQAVAPPFFKLVFNSQFMGADIAGQITQPGLVSFLGILIVIGTTSWAFGYIIARVYNRSA